MFEYSLLFGPCAGKTTGQASLSSFFENLGWKVYRVPEAANTLLSGGVRFSELSPHDCHVFQENLLKTMMQIEQTYMALAETCAKNCLIICDRGTMDASAYLEPAAWEKIMKQNNLNAVDIRDNRYNQVIHLVTAANGAETFYTLANHTCRSEGVNLARELDEKVMKAWIGHPYLEVMDNTTTFDMKMRRLVQSVCARLGLDTGDRLLPNSRKRKFLVREMQADSAFHEFQDFVVEHDYLITASHEFEQARLRKRGQNNHWQYLHTVRRLVTTGDKHEHIEQRTQLTERDYFMLLAQRDPSHYRLYKKRRCFLWNNQYFQLDIYTEKNPSKIRGLKILETYTARTEAIPLPEFLDIEAEITADKTYSMYNLSRKEIVDPNIIHANRHEKSKSPLHFSKIEVQPERSISVSEPINGHRDSIAAEKHRAHSVVENGVVQAQAHADLLKNPSMTEASKVL
ncbi:TRPL translocation defect protein 14-like isoform X2 [Paramacrobiotus metropolitanus]|uniref:TRPL translocation defect protein 14-like isoform X2 n=1 Tax=Paramacrobiotus metropolitanus TaxID=2943436 RepID=UPI002445B181|nr:TRPL translocation defect protein 14-like isoform X2 [Paramacrobiotus metropolitanus]